MTISTVKSTVPKHLRDEWRTPLPLFDLLNDEFQFVVDVAASHNNALCPEYITAQNNALAWNWYTVYGPGPYWMNPPFSLKHLFLAKAQEAVDEGATIVALLRAAAPETKWWREGVLEIDGSPLDHLSPFPFDGTTWYRPRHEIRYLVPRVHYELPEWEGWKQGSGADYPSCIVVMRPEPVSIVRWWRWKSES